MNQTQQPRADQVLDQLRGLRRSSDDRMIAGVCGGVARSLGIDPLLLRVVLAVLVLFGGTGVVLYALGWLLIPVDDGTPALGAQVLESGRFRPTAGTVVLAVVLAVAVTIGVVGAFAQWHGSVILALVVVGVLVLLLRQDHPSGAAQGAAPQPTPSVPPWAPGPAGPAPAAPAAGTTDSPAGAQTAATAAAPVSTTPPSGPSPAAQAAPTVQVPVGPGPDVPPTQTWGAVPGAPTAPPPAPPSAGWAPPPGPVPPAPRRPRSHLFGITVSSALIALGVLAAVDLGGVDVPAGAYPATALGVVALGLLAGTWFGRSRGLVFWGIVLIPVLSIATIASDAQDLATNAVDESVVITRVDQVPTDDRFGAGQVTYDLTGLDLTSGPAALSSHIGFGELVVVVPLDADVHVDAKVGVGGLTLFGRDTGGVSEQVTRYDTGPDGVGGGTIDLTLYAGFGHLEVRRAAA